MDEEIQNSESDVAVEAEKESPKSRLPLMVAAGLVLIVGGAFGTIAYLGVASARVSIDTAQIQAPEIALAPTTPGVLKQMYVQAGDVIPANTVVAQVGTELIKSTSAGLVISTSDQVGAIVSAASPVATMIDPSALRVVGKIEEDKGLSRIAVGDRVVFTVDAFGSQKFNGVVDEVSPTSHASDVVFSISDKREVQKFDVKVAYDQTQYPQLKNGMSARINVYTK
ncbi:MAG: secretion protein HlyD family protein [Parcubacteria group bacterium]|nr:secretion protein HlyD family protein [Parcubacteria group bacterium]